METCNFGYPVSRKQMLFYVVIGWIFILIQPSEGQHIVITPHGPQIKKTNSGIIFTCTVVEYLPIDGKPQMTWKDSLGQTITDDSTQRVHVERLGTLSHRLYIKQIEEADAGVYTCDVTLGGGEQMPPGKTKLVLYEAIAFSDSPTVVQHQIGSRPLIACAASGSPEPEISWRFKRMRITSDDVKYKYEAEGLRIENLDLRDAGVYECRASVASQGTLKVKTIALEIMYPPVFSTAPNKTTVAIEGKTVELKCQAHGTPEVKFEWYKEQKMSEFAIVRVKLAEDIQVFFIQNVIKEDEGRYFCKATNDMGSKEVFTDVKVMVPPIVQELDHKVVLETGLLTLPCEVSGVPEPEIKWRRADSDEFYIGGVQPDDPRVTVDNSQPGLSKLMIHDVQRGYSGEYVCTARNLAGHQTKTGMVTVEFYPTVNTTEYEKFGWPGEVRNFTCTGYGNPLPDMSWFRAGQHIPGGATYRVYTTKSTVITSTLQITIRPDQSYVFGEYSCIAKNKHHLVSTVIYLREALPPDIPGNVSVAEQLPEKLTFKADLPKDNGGLPITSWKVDYEPTKETVGERLKSAFFGVGEKLTVSGLKAGRLYTFYISVGNAAGFGQSAKVKVKVPRKISLEPVADLPRTGVRKRPGQNDTSDEKEALLKNSPKEVDKSEASTDDVGSSLGVVVGSTVVLAVLITALVIAIVWMRRKSKRGDYSFLCGGKKAAKSKKNKGDNNGQLSATANNTTVTVSGGRDIDTLQLEIRRADGAGGLHHLPEGVQKTPDFKRKSPSEIRKNGILAGATKSPNLGAHQAALLANIPNTIQQQAWDLMLEKQQLGAEEGYAETETRQQQEVTPMMDIDLPPPPPFLLENNEADDQEDALSYQDILDGYHSEENIDDADNFEITIPPAYNNNNNGDNIIRT